LGFRPLEDPTKSWARSVLFGDYPCPVLQPGMDSSSAAQPNARILGSTQTNFRVSGSGSNVHPYCSTWYTWPLMIRPVAYFYQTAQTATASYGTFPACRCWESSVRCCDWKSALWWLSTAAILFYCGCWGNESGLATRQRLNASTLGCPNCSYLDCTLPGS